MATRVKIAPLLFAQLLLQRFEWVPLLALLFCLLGVGLEWLALPKIEQRTHAVAASLIDDPSGRGGRLDDDTLQADRYRAFRDRLGSHSDRGNMLKAVFSEAAAAGIPLAQGDYTLVAEADGNYDKLQIILPIKGTYQQIRAYAKALLEKLPQLSLDEINFRRDNIKSSAVEARLRLTLYLNRAE